MTDLELARQQLAAGEYTCVLCGKGLVYTATARGVRPLADWLDSGLDLRSFSAADRVVGRATAFLYVLLGVRAVHARVMSTPARQALEENGIAASCDREVRGIINRTGTGPCPFEEAVLGIADPHEALLAIRKKQFVIRQPDLIRTLTAGQDFTLDRTGLSGSTVALFQDAVLKCEPVGRESDTNLAMLRWLKGKLPVPEVLAVEESGGYRWLLMSRLPGSMSCDERWKQDPARMVRLCAELMKKLWSVDVRACPVDEGLSEKLRRARVLVDRGEVDLALADPETFSDRGFASPAVLLSWLQENRPEPDPVLSHGDLCMPNIFIQEWKLSGLLDLGRSGVSDRWVDIAICWRSLRDNFGGQYGEAVPGFDPDILFDALEIEKDEVKLRYYLLLDELF